MAHGMILDHRGRPLRRRPIIGTEYAGIEGGRDVTRGYIDDQLYLTPQDKVLRYQSGNYELYEDMLQDDRVKSAFGQRRAAVVAREWAVEPGGARRRDRMAADHLRETLKHVQWDRVTDMMLYGVFYGYSVAEVLWARDGRYVAMDRIRVRNRRRFVFDVHFHPLLLTAGNPNGEALPQRKFWCFSAGADNDDEPYGRGLAHFLYWPIWFKKNQTRFWLLFLEKFGMPTPTAKYSRDEDKKVALDLARAVHVDAALAVPEGVVLEFLEAMRSGSVDYGDFRRAMNDAITTIILSQTMTTEDGSSLSQAQVHMEVRREVVESDAWLIDESFRRGPAAWWTAMNHPGAATPEVRRVMEGPAELKDLAARDKTIVDMGHPLTAEYVEQTYHVEVDRTARPAPAPPPASAEPPDPTTDLAEGDRQRGSTDPPAAPPARARDAGGDRTRAPDGTLEAADPLPALTARTRATLGPLVDAWAADVRSDLDDAGSLDDVRARLDALLAWTRSPVAPTPDVADAAAALQPALAAAHLAGRFDVVEEARETTRALATDAGARIALAEASVSHTRLPFAEQIEFFRSKLDLPTESWTDIWHDAHDRAFVVAGAAHADLVADLRTAVDKAIAEGTTLATFRKDFDAIVAKHGWSYNGGRDWRTRVIYGTNLRTSYAAGRYQQMKDVAEHRPFWRYRHSDASEQPRHDHLAWDGLILRHDDPWWDTHSPPNGWGCKCYVETLAERDLKRLGKAGPDSAPAVRTRTVTVGAKGPSPRTVTVPVGIDPGWAYAPGKSVLKRPPTPADPFTVPELSRADATAHRVGAQAGSNPGGLYRGTDGKLRYVKYYDDAAQSYGEAVANNAYRALGLDAPASALVRDGNAIVGIANEYIDHAGTLGSAKRLAKGRARKVLDGYAADVWLANWDAVGLNLDNVVATRAARNAVARIDQGGALLMRARRGRKPAGVLDGLTEWEGFSNPQRNPAYVRVLRAAGVESGDALGRAALKQIAAIEALGKRTRDFRDLAPKVRGVADADQTAILAALRTRAQLLKRRIDPRVRKAMAEARALPAYARETRSRMGQVYTGYLSRGQRKVEEGFEPHRMTDPELAVSYAYTTSDVPWGYQRPNRALRDAERDGTMVPAQYDDYRKTLSDALRKLPDYPAAGLRRGVTLSPAEIARYEPGRVVTEAGFTSASYGRGFSGNVQFIIHSRHGKRIDQLSAYPKEREVLFDAGTRFRVLDRRRQSGVVEIEMEEVDDA